MNCYFNSVEWSTKGDSEHPVVHVQGTDADSGENGMLYYYFKEEIHPFYMQKENGKSVVE